MGARVKVLYIAGAGRSGSTILDTVLGQLEGFVSVGELRYIWERGLLQNRPCGCGAPFRACPVWTGVIDEAYGNRDGVDPRAMRALQARGTRARHIPLLLGSRRQLRRHLGEYLRHLEQLYRAVARRTGARVIVDSSKLPTYGRLLDTLPGLDLHVVHLVRDPRATAYSWLRVKPLPDTGGQMQRQGPGKSALLWALWNAVAELLWSRRKGRYLRIRYEDFVARPRETVERVVALTGEAVAELPFVTEASVRLGPTHTVAGNPGRFETGVVAIRPDLEWRDRMRARDRATVVAIAWPLMLRHGYLGR